MADMNEHPLLLMRIFTTLLLGFAIVACSPGINDGGTSTGKQDVEDGGSVKNAHRDKAQAFFNTLSKARTKEEERAVVTELANWMNVHNYKVEVTEENGAHVLACPYFPPVTPWVKHTFVDVKHLELLPQLEH